MDIAIGDIIKKELEKSGISASQFAQRIYRDRTIIYHIFKRKSLDTDLLYDISMALNTDFFKYYTEALKEGNEIIRLHEERGKKSSLPMRKIMVEIEVSEEEYRHLVDNCTKKG